MKRIIYLLLLVLFSIEMSNAQTDDIVRKRSERNTQQQQNGHVGIDLGITDAQGKTICWATCNVGASNPWEYGHYFAWGETKCYSSDVTYGHKFDWSNYKWCKGAKMTKYCIDSKYGAVDGKKELEASDDAATAQWDVSWRMPTRSELDKLKKECYWQWVTSYQGHSVSGYVVYKAKSASDKGMKIYNKPSLCSTYSESDPHIFLPAAGYRYNSDLYCAGSNGNYWSSSLSSSYSSSAYYLSFDSSSVLWYGSYRYYGLSVRPVCQ